MEKNRRKEILRSESLRSPAGRLGKRGTDTPQPGQEGRGSRGKDQSYGQHLACRARAHHGGGGPHTSARFLRPRRQRPRPPPAVPVAAPRGARSFVPPKSQGGRGPRQAAPRPPARRSATRHKARRGEAGRIRQGSADPGQAGAGPSPRARPGWGPGGCSTHPGEEALPELDPLQALYVEHGGARPKGLTAAAGSLLLAPSTHPVPSQAVTSARHSDLT